MSVSDKTQKYLNMLEESFDRNNFCEFIKDLLNLETADIVNGSDKHATSEQYKNYIDSSSLYAQYSDNKRRKIGVIIIKLHDNKTPANARTLQRNYIAHLLSDNVYDLDAALTAIYSNTDNTWRLSFVKKEISIEVGKLKTKVSPAKRYSYLFGKDEPNHTAKEQLVDFIENNTKKYSVDELEEKFSVEKVTKDFFEKYKENYLKLKEKLENNEEFLSEAERCDFTSEEFTKKLMGQLIFLYFLQKKGWLGVKLVPNILSIEEYNIMYSKQDALGKKILDKYYIKFNNGKKVKKDLLEKYKENLQDIDILSTIFVGTKYDNAWGTGEKRFIRRIFDNCVNRNKNFFDDYLEPFFYDGLNHRRKNQYFSTFNCKIPFLNGGLFEPLDNYMWESSNFNLDNDIFAEILDFFDRYNFTMNEEEPLEKDVAVDPEMLGKIFENLLDVKDRKSKGAFYTPREIVHYMCQESLANYLVNKVGVKYEEIKEFIQYGEMIRDIDLKNATRNNYLAGETVFKSIMKIDEALKNIKVADPSVGSGAFPLGMLNEIVKLRDILTSYMLIYNRERIFEKIYNEEQITSNNRTIYKIKWETIKNCIYAVDIENSAVDITKLRLWLSIVVDQAQNTEPEPLPNLDCKIMQGNSLVDEYAGIKLIDEKFIEEFKNGKSVKFNDGGKIKEKGKYVEIFGEQIQFGDGQKKVQIDDLIRLKQELYEENDTNRKKNIIEKIQSARKELLRLNFQGTNKEKELFTIDKSHNKPYFAWMLEFIEVFIENDGFDIVIGNPPYVGQKGNKEIFRDIEKTNFGKKFNQGKMDLFYYFFHKGLDIGNSKCELSFITTNYYLTAFGGKVLRHDFKERTQIRNLINFNELKIFETAMGQHNIITILTKNHDTNIISKNIMCNLKGKATAEDINKVVNEKCEKTVIYNVEQKSLYDGNEYYIRMNGIDYGEDASLNKILGKISDSEFLFKDIADIKQGIVSGADKVTQNHIDTYNIQENKDTGIFILNNYEIANLGFLNEYEKNLIKPIYKNSEIKKYSVDYKNEMNVIYINKEVEYNEIPNIIRHLEKFKDVLSAKRETVEGKLPWYCLHWSRSKDFFESDNKIVNSRRSKLNTFALSSKEYFEQSDIMIARIKDNYINIFPKEYILGLLNSKLYLFWLNNKGKIKGSMLELYGKPLEEIPISNCGEELKKQIIDKVKLQTVNYSDSIQDEIDVLIYKIFKITHEEINIIEKNLNDRGV